ncbi:hypothetical protein KBD71_05835 [Candidatus Woesebacteria bacterium]|nr:hypothetical protein [Candidatus Woesebacteria bacterium]
MKTIKELLRTVQRLDINEEKPKRGSDFPEKPKLVDQETDDVWNDIQEAAFNSILVHIRAWGTSHLTVHKLSPNVSSAELAIRDLIAIYSLRSIPDYLGLSANEKHAALIVYLNRSMLPDNMKVAELHLERALNAHPNQKVALRLHRASLLKVFLGKVRQLIIAKAVKDVDAAFQTHLASQLILDPEKAAEPAPKRGPFTRRS